MQKITKQPARILLILGIFICNLQIGYAQKESKFKKWMTQLPDTNYVVNYAKDLIIRGYVSQKYSFQKLFDRDQDMKLSYRPSNGYSIGVGLNYKFLGLNIGTIMPFAKPSVYRYGDCHALDLQSHIYLRRFTVDIYSGFYHGQYLDNTVNVLTNPPSGRFYFRNDLRSYSGGLNLYVNLNPKKYSFRAPFLQNERQKKSAGQPMAGIEVYVVGAKADSSIIPAAIKKPDFYNGVEFRRWQFLTTDLTGGYAYTFVIHQRFFLMLGLNASIGVSRGVLEEINNKKDSKFVLDMALNQRAGAGYNWDKFFLGVTYTNFQYFWPAPIANTRINWGIGDIRFNAAYRFKLKHEIKLLPWKWFSKRQEKAL
jgi:hypothetical protein